MSMFFMRGQGLTGEDKQLLCMLQPLKTEIERSEHPSNATYEALLSSEFVIVTNPLSQC